MKKLSRGPAIALSTILGLGLVGGGTAGAIAMDKDTVTITTDGKSSIVQTRAKDVAGLLDQQGIKVGERDVVQPSLDTRIAEGAKVTVLFSRQVTVTVDGKKISRWTTATTVDKALEELNLDDPKNILSTNRSTAIGREGLDLTVTTLKKVEVKTWKFTKTVEVPSNATVSEALEKAGVTFGKRDKVNPTLDTPITKAAKITFNDAWERPVIVKEEIPFKTIEKKDPTLEKGEKKVLTKGLKGTRTNTVLQIWLDGKLVSNHRKIKSVVTKKPVDEVIAIGTKEPEKEKEQTSKSTSTSSTSSDDGGSATPKAGGYSGSCEASNYWDPQPTASGEPFNPYAMTAAHKTLPMGTRLKVTNVANGKSVIVRINDRGPYVGGRCLDLAKGAFLKIAPESAGVAQVTYVQV